MSLIANEVLLYIQPVSDQAKWTYSEMHLDNSELNA